MATFSAIFKVGSQWLQATGAYLFCSFVSVLRRWRSGAFRFLNNPKVTSFPWALSYRTCIIWLMINLENCINKPMPFLLKMSRICFILWNGYVFWRREAGSEEYFLQHDSKVHILGWRGRYGDGWGWHRLSLVWTGKDRLQFPWAKILGAFCGWTYVMRLFFKRSKLISVVALSSKSRNDRLLRVQYEGWAYRFSQCLRLLFRQQILINCCFPSLGGRRRRCFGKTICQPIHAVSPLSITAGNLEGSSPA